MPSIKRTITIKLKRARENNWLIFWLRGYITLLQWISANNSDPEVIGDTNVALNEAETLLRTLKKKGRFR